MNGFDNAWLAGIGADWDGRREFPRVPASGNGVDVAIGRNTRVADASRSSGAEPNPSRAGAAEPRHKSRSRPEEALQVSIVRAFRPQLVPGARLFATNGELPGGAEQVRRAGRRKQMGYMRGTPDLCARRPGFLGWIEAKAGRNTQTHEQALWADWAQSIGDGYAVVNSIEDAGAVLRIWGMLA